mgnify:CR=1 FL=1
MLRHLFPDFVARTGGVARALSLFVALALPGFAWLVAAAAPGAAAAEAR